jgi:alpha/beta superfamily hydrolase
MMNEERVCFRSGRNELEGWFCNGGPDKGVVITHPHPLYGGDMTSPVVEAIAAAYHRCGFATLRFNFRGTGRSSGNHDNGEGEQADVSAAVAFMNAMDLERIHLSGYSFGAWVNARALQGRLTTDGLTMVAPPVAFVDFSSVTRLPALFAVIAGERDTFAPPQYIQPQLKAWNSSACLDVIAAADHFFFGFLDEISRRLVAHLRERVR